MLVGTAAGSYYLWSDTVTTHSHRPETKCTSVHNSGTAGSYPSQNTPATQLSIAEIYLSVDES